MRVQVGKFEFNISTKELIIKKEVGQALEEFIRDVQTSSLLVRLDMAPWDGQGPPPIYEVETAPGGLWMLPLVGHSEMLEEVRTLADVALCLDADWLPAYELLGWRLIVESRQALQYTRIYFSGSPEELGEYGKDLRSRIITDPWGATEVKVRVVEKTGGRILQSEDNLEKLLTEFAGGFALKPVDGWGSRGLYIYAPAPPHKEKSETKTKMSRVLDSALLESRRWLVQPFFCPALDGMGWTIWRVYAVRYSTSHPFRIIGGVWNARPSLKVHGASDATFGPLSHESHE